MYTVQNIRLDPDSRRVWRGDEELTFSRKEFDLLHALMSRAGKVVTRAELMRDVWNNRLGTSTKTIDVHLGWVRRKLGENPRQPRLITTVRGRGLRFEAQLEIQGASGATKVGNAASKAVATRRLGEIVPPSAIPKRAPKTDAAAR